MSQSSSYLDITQPKKQNEVEIGYEEYCKWKQMIDRKTEMEEAKKENEEKTRKQLVQDYLLSQVGNIRL